MVKVNIINDKAIDDWLYMVAWKNDASETAGLLSLGLKRHLLKDSATAEVLLPEDAPSGRGTNGTSAARSTGLRRRKIRAEWQDPAHHRLDCLDAGERRLGERVNGKPKVLLHFQSVDDACAKADKYFAALNKKFAKAARAKEDTDIKTVLDFGDGMKIVELLTPEALKIEGPKMGHCVGGGAYDDGVKQGTKKIYSLRDRGNEPHATFEVDVADNSLLQCKGKENKPAAAKYMSYVEKFVRENKFKLTEQAQFTNLLQSDDGTIYNVYKLPKHLSIKGDLDLSFFRADLTELPDSLSVSGSLALSDCKRLRMLRTAFLWAGIFVSTIART